MLCRDTFTGAGAEEIVVRKFRFADAQDGAGTPAAVNGPATKVGNISVKIWRSASIAKRRPP